jgi:hypothetical protein
MHVLDVKDAETKLDKLNAIKIGNQILDEQPEPPKPVELKEPEPPKPKPVELKEPDQPEQPKPKPVVVKSKDAMQRALGKQLSSEEVDMLTTEEQIKLGYAKVDCI